MNERPPSGPRSEDPLENLLVELIDLVESGTPDLIEDFLGRHPDEEVELRALLASLSDLSLIDDQGAQVISPPFASVADFHLLRLLGRGGMGEVWLAEQRSLRRPVAIKVIRAGFGTTDRTRERFRREARAMALIDDPHVVRVHGSGTHESGVDWIAMEYVPGRGLDEIFLDARRDPKQLASKTLLTWGVQIAGALVQAHAAGLIHRDIKPSNIRIRPGGEAVLIDFGLARHLHEGSLSQSGDFVGSPHYAAPEQISGDFGKVGPATDLYGLALTLYEGLTGSRPFEGESAEAVFRRILDTDPIRPSRISSRVSRDLEIVLLTALQKEPKRRYTDAQGLREDLSACLSRRPIHARPESRLRRLGRWVRRRPARAALAAFLVSCVLAGGWIAWKLPEIRRLRAEERRWAVEAAIEEGFTFQSVGLLESARDRFEAALDLDSRHREAMVGYCLTLIEERRDDELYAWMDARDQEQPASRILALIRRIAMRIHGRPGPQPTVKPPHDAVESFLLGHVALAAGLDEKAYEHLQNANLIVEESRPPYVFDLIQAASRLGRHEEALRFLELARLRWPGHPTADFIEASLNSSRDPARAQELLEGVLHELPECFSAWMNLGLARFRGGDAEGAIDALRRGLVLAPHHDPMRCSLAEILYRSGRVDEAITEFERVVAGDPDYQDAWYGLSHCWLVLKNDPARALAPARRAVALDSEDAEARQRLVLAARWTGSFEALASSSTWSLRERGWDLELAFDALRALVELGRPADAAAVLNATAGSDSKANLELAKLAARWTELATGSAWQKDANLETDDLLALLRIFRGRDDPAAERAIVERLRRNIPDDREFECRAELARCGARAAAEGGAGSRELWDRVLEDLDLAYDAWSEPSTRMHPRLHHLPELAPVFQAEIRSEQLPPPLRPAAEELTRHVTRLHAEHSPF
ncbi:MAG: protein kinase [Planctomycetes bacterium]|nr:protein kinase [Planctomycetota bacterium]